MIGSMTENEIETLLILLNEQGDEIRERDAELKQDRVSYLDRESPNSCGTRRSNMRWWAI